MDLELLLSALTAKDTKQNYGALLDLERLSEERDDLYPDTERFADMVDDRAYAVRVRGFRLLCRQARWDEGGVIDRRLDRALAALLELVPYKKALWPQIRERVERMDPNRWRDSMAPLIEKDIRRLLDQMK